ncbi:hypothetical protein M407DRAFT_19605 [Tulasnella calospora MUT 4182]|uniref:Uncharacterized protein n=1 Tax=Tulasnella calospora MUT 4182 TaxID=1051891 RepID=A0A0C3QHS4_9AGAM|nr:hypothetical protein M407DRAFT_19605 [Tulasnella calospora MUT 4182]
MDVSAFFPDRRWELSTENVLATQMFDTLVPSIERHVLATAARLVELNSVMHLFGKFMTLVFQQEPLHSCPGEYQRLLDSSRHLAEECATLHSTLENLVRFFRKVITQYDDAGHSSAWTSKLDFHVLSQRWRRIHAQVGQCRKSILKHQPTLAALQPSLIFHDKLLESNAATPPST